MKTWLNEFINDLRFLGRKSRRLARVYVKSLANERKPFRINGVASRDGRSTNFADPLTSETLLTGEPAHYVGQNMARIDASEESMGVGSYH